MIYRDTKIRYDGSHWIGLYHTESGFKRGPSRFGKLHNVVVNHNDVELKLACELASDSINNVKSDEKELLSLFTKNSRETFLKDEKGQEHNYTYSITKKSLFNSLYNLNRKDKIDKRTDTILKTMSPLFTTKEDAEYFVDDNVKRMQRNMTLRRMRFVRKCKMTKFNYFVTFTYDDNKMDENQFRKKLLNCIRHLANRAGWKYAGVWERGGKTQRLHFHALFYIPEGTFRGKLIERTTYSFKQHKRVTILENTFFRQRFGMNEFEAVDDYSYNSCINYIMKYLEKSGEKITYSRGLPLYYVCDTSSDDVLLQLKDDNPFKVILSPDFVVYKNGSRIGAISPEIIKTLRIANN